MSAGAAVGGGVPGVSVIIPNLNSPIIDRTLDAIRTQEYDLTSVEVLVVGLDEPGLVFQDSLVRLIPTDGPASPARARNLGIGSSRGAIICFTDADCIPNTLWLSRITAPIQSGAAAVTGGGVRFDAVGYWALADNISWFHDHLVSSPPGERRILPSLNLCLRRDVTERVGLFDESYPRAAGEDAEWTARMRFSGYRLIFCPDAWVFHDPPSRSGLASVLRHSYTYGQYSIKLSRTCPQTGLDSILLRSWLAILLLSPAISLVAALRIFFSDGTLMRFAYTLPGVWLTKMAWVLGAVVRLRNRAAKIHAD